MTCVANKISNCCVLFRGFYIFIMLVYIIDKVLNRGIYVCLLALTEWLCSTRRVEGTVPNQHNIFRLLHNAHQYTLSQNSLQVLACCTFDIHKRVLIIFGRTVKEKTNNQNKMLYFTYLT